MTNHIKEDKKALKTMIILFKAHQSLIQFIKEDIKETGFDMNEFSVFEVIYHQEKLKVKEIKEKVLIANSSLTYILNKLKEKELVQSEESIQDKRIKYIFLTEKGKKKALKIFPKHYNNLKEIFNILKEEELNNLNEGLKKIGFTAKKRLEKWNIFILIIEVIIHL